MKTATHEDYERLIDIGESMLKNTHEHWHEIPVERMPLARFGQGSDALFVAVGHLMLREIQQARAWFAIAGQFFLEAGKPPDTVISEKRALECALFSGDRDFRLRVAQKTPPRDEAVKPVEYPYVMFLKHMILHELPEACTFTEEAVWLSRATIQQRGGYGTLQPACQALAAGETGTFRTALEAVLREHKMKASHGHARLPDGMLCFPGAALLILAREQGMVVDVTSPFLPAALFE